MAYEPMSLPFWSVASWNPNVNEARANGEYPTAGWANQLQALHDETIAKVNEIGVLADDVIESAGVIGDMHPPGTILIAGENGFFKELTPGTFRQVLQPDSNLAEGVSWRHFGSSDTPAKGDILAFDGTQWVNVPTTGVSTGAFLRYDTGSPTNVSWVSDATSTGDAGYLEITKSAHGSYTHTPGPWYMARRIDGVYSPSADLIIVTRRLLTFAANSVVTFGVIPPAYRPMTNKTVGTLPLYNPADGTSTNTTASVTINTVGQIQATISAWGTQSLVNSTSDTNLTIIASSFTYTL